MDFGRPVNGLTHLHNIGKRVKRKKSNGDTDNQKIKTKRRAFLKKSVYKAPALIVLGSLAKSTGANAGWVVPGSS